MRAAIDLSRKEDKMNEIITNLWLGSWGATREQDFMNQYGITHVLSLGVMPKNVPVGGTSKYIEAEDDEQ